MGAPPATSAVGVDLASVLPKDGKPWYKRPHLVKLNFSLMSLVLLASAGGYDGSLMNGILALPEWFVFMNDPAGEWLGFINAAYWLGLGIAFPAAAAISNRWGRKIGIYIGHVVVLVGTVLQTAANNDAAFVMARLILGCGTGFYSANVPLLISETAYPTQRAIVSALFNCGFYIGSLIAALATFGTRFYTNSWGWRIPSALQALLPLVGLPGLLMMPESPRWLISVDRQEEARRILHEIHAGKDADCVDLVNYEIMEIETTIAAEKAAHSSASYADMVKTPGNRRRLLISITLGVFSQWGGNGVISYYLALVLTTVGITDVTNQLAIAIALQIWNFFWAVVAASLVDKVGRRVLFLSSAALMFVSFIIVTGLSGSFASTGNSATGIAVIPFLFLFFAGYDIALTPLLVAYPCEIWPFALRSRGLTVTFVAVVVAIFFNTFVNPIALEAIAWKYYFVFIAVCGAYGITAYFYYPETRGHSLEQMALIFDGDDAAVPMYTDDVKQVGSIDHLEETVIEKA